MPIEELKTTLLELVHEPTGAQVMHLANEDPENLFCLSFRTLPTDSKGVAHILEHTVLCGSKKYPIKDPFFAMTRRSLNTYMNALTGSDFTCYPAASQVEKDFYNLFEVYIDAVFNPELKKVSFLQEGHRLEFAEANNPKSPLEFKGIVFNEMKGSMASPDARLWHTLMEALVPDLPYSHNAGGDPVHIPELTYDELTSFHQTYYHPSRCLFFFYGNLPLKRHLDYLEEHALKNVRPLPPVPSLPLQRRFKKPVTTSGHYPINEGESLSSKTIHAFGWLTTPVLEQEEVLALSVLDSILMDTDASLLKLPLLKSGLCTQADAYMDIEMSEVPYLIACKGCEKESGEKLEKQLLETLHDIVKKGIPAPLIETAIHQLEFARTEITGDASPFGLTLFMRSALAKQHGCPPENALKIHSRFQELIAHTKDPRYLPMLIQKYFLDNAHRVRLVLTPDPTLSNRELEKEKETLSKIQKKLSPKETEQILKQAEELEHYQQETEKQNIEILPKVTLDDVPVLIHDLTLKQEKEGELSVFHHTAFTNHILYADLVFDMPEIDEEELPYVQLLFALIPELGAGKRSYAENLAYIQSHTGGIAIATHLHPQVEDHNQLKPSWNLHSKALFRKRDKLFSLIKEIAESPQLNDKERLSELILQMSTALESHFNKNALRYALQLALSGISVSGYINECWGGLNYYKMILALAHDLPKKLPGLIDRLVALKEKLFCVNSPSLVLSCDEEMYQKLKSERFFDLNKLPLKKAKPWTGNYAYSPTQSHARAISTPVAFTVQAHKSVGYLHPHAPALATVMHLFENKILHRYIREKGGAYGAGASYGASAGVFYFHSYRDPHLASTLATFGHAIDEIARGDFNERELEEAKLGVIQHLDAPLAPGSRAMQAYGWFKEGKTKERRQHFRDTLLALTKQQIIHMVQSEILPKKRAARSSPLQDPSS